MILIDWNQLCVSNIAIHSKNVDVQDINMIRHMILTSIKKIKNKFGDEFGELVIACDSDSYWRKKYFPYYKIRRVATKEKSKIDWKLLYENANIIREELKENFQYRIIRVNDAEADDIIATICKENGNFMNYGEKILIYSSDEDFLQLQKFSNIKQYSTSAKKFLETNDPERELKEHIILGCNGDDIPNVLSDSDCFALKKRQTPIRTTKLSVWLDEPIENLFETTKIKMNYDRNKALIDFDCIPSYVNDSILESFEIQESKPKKNLLNYFIKNKLKMLIPNISDFYQ